MLVRYLLTWLSNRLPNVSSVLAEATFGCDLQSYNSECSNHGDSINGSHVHTVDCRCHVVMVQTALSAVPLVPSPPPPPPPLLLLPPPRAQQATSGRQNWSFAILRNYTDAAQRRCRTDDEPIIRGGNEISIRKTGTNPLYCSLTTASGLVTQNSARGRPRPTRGSSS
jgi:hypothetical protein